MGGDAGGESGVKWFHMDLWSQMLQRPDALPGLSPSIINSTRPLLTTALNKGMVVHDGVFLGWRSCTSSGRA